MLSLFRPVCSGLPDAPQQPAPQPVCGSHLLPHGMSEVCRQTTCASPAGTLLVHLLLTLPSHTTFCGSLFDQTCVFRVSPSCGGTWSCVASVRRACTTWAERCTSWASHIWPYITTRRPLHCLHRSWRFIYFLHVSYIIVFECSACCISDIDKYQFLCTVNSSLSLNNAASQDLFLFLSFPLSILSTHSSFCRVCQTISWI